MNLESTGVWYFTDGMSAHEAADAARRIESLGYSALWIPEAFGRNPFAHAAWLLASTKSLIVATGIANIYHREPAATLSAQNTLAEQSDGRFLLGLGVSHKPMVEGARGLTYGKPVATMRAYLEKMADTPYMGPMPEKTPPIVLAALGPKMLALSAELTAGAHPYFTSPDHTKMARETLGPDSWLCVEQKVIMETDPDKARQLGRGAAKTYARLPNYRNNWRRMGLAESDLDNGGSDAFIDATFAWGDVATIKTRIQAHYDAGASHVCIQPINPSGNPSALHWPTLEALAS